MTSDVEIARAASLQPIQAIAARLGLTPAQIEPYGHDKAKLDAAALLRRPRHTDQPARLILVSAITPTPAGEGKTTTSIGLGQALDALGLRVCVALREPSLGPCMGVKGGATGGGHSQLAPADSINLHFTGDFHAITSAHNLIAAVLDNHLHHGNALDLDPRRIAWRRVMDMNDRALRDIVIGLGGPAQGVPRESGFDITAASEVMAILCLAEDRDDLQRRLERAVLGFTRKQAPVTVGQLNITGALMALLRDALKPNLVQTLEGTPALVHGGPFANIAHGCNSVLATRAALHLADWVVTEAGFAFDLGAEKFFHIKCRSAGLDPAAVVIVATARALKMHGGVARADLTSPNVEALRRGLPNLDKHVESARALGKNPVIAINRFASDDPAELDAILEHCAALGCPCALSDHHARGGQGALDLARLVVEAAQAATPWTPLYQPEDTLPSKLTAVAQTMYGAREVKLSSQALKDLAQLEKIGAAHLPVCFAKTQSSLSDEPDKLGRPTDFDIHVQRLVLSAGAGFVVVMTGELLRMPGLPASPQAERLKLLDDGSIAGLS
jgi:formate--tetrahydrofolate ligase